MNHVLVSTAVLLSALTSGCVELALHHPDARSASSDAGRPDAGFLAEPVEPAVATVLPRLQVDVNGVYDAQAEAGWPLRVEVLLSHPERRQVLEDGGAPPPLPVSSAKGAWFERATVRLRTSGGAELATLRRFTTPPNRAALAVDALLGAAFVADEGTMAALAPGNYLIDVEVPWTVDGAADARLQASRRLRVTAPSGTVAAAVKKAELAAAVRYMQDDLPGALALADAVAAMHPGEPAALALKAELLEVSGDKAAAYTLFRQAIAASDGGASVQLRNRADRLASELGRNWWEP